LLTSLGCFPVALYAKQVSLSPSVMLSPRTSSIRSRSFTPLKPLPEEASLVSLVDATFRHVPHQSLLLACLLNVLSWKEDVLASMKRVDRFVCDVWSFLVEALNF